MTDNEIVKALECCTSGAIRCRDCCFFNDNFCRIELIKKAFDLINRQKAELERLQSQINGLEGLVEAKTVLLTDANYSLLTAKSEAVKAFAERLKEKWRVAQVGRLFNLHEEIDSLVKEMVGENNGE